MPFILNVISYYLIFKEQLTYNYNIGCLIDFGKDYIQIKCFIFIHINNKYIYIGGYD